MRKNKDNRNGVSVTWKPETDYHAEPPCLILIDCKIQDQLLYMTAYFRSHDIYKGYCMNIIALQSLQEKIINSINEDHDYESDLNNNNLNNNKEMPEFKIVNNKIEILPRYPITKPESELVKRGYFVIDLIREEKKISVTLMNNKNEPVMHFKENDIHKLRDLCQPYISEISHSLYLGSELQRAKHCLDSGENYTQD